jgi:hypothetical protein
MGDVASRSTVSDNRRMRTALVFLLAATACASLTPEQQAALQKVDIRASDPANDCQNLGPVSGARDGDGAGSLRGKTVLLGGNTVLATGNDGTAFYCPPPKGPPLQVPVIKAH